MFYIVAISAATLKARNMTCVPAHRDAALDTLSRMPAWVTSALAETLEDVAFLSGAALVTQHFVVSGADLSHS